MWPLCISKRYPNRRKGCFYQLGLTILVYFTRFFTVVFTKQTDWICERVFTMTAQKISFGAAKPVLARARANMRPGRDFWYAIDKAAGRC